MSCTTGPCPHVDPQRAEWARERIANLSAEIVGGIRVGSVGLLPAGHPQAQRLRSRRFELAEAQYELRCALASHTV